ncbi:MAG: Asp-tRNA(Asn)/Glu-tRNA(Gln) amidotransferase subunit GatA [Planctomycetota bacterium]|nr:Asp-tRNA(Asn)/Glu-tRNA(Gln) amidotransferase subunit GatA [Planctomycetota bacterium]
MNFIQQTAFDLVQGLASGSFSSEEVTKDFIQQILHHDNRVGAYLKFDPTDPLTRASEFDRVKKAQPLPGPNLGQLCGLPVAVKDVICVKDQTTSCSSRILEQFIAPYDATVVEQLKKANGIVLGRTNMDEFAMGSSTENSAYQTTQNPWKLDCVPGGSSGGAAACVAARMAPLSLGSDTGGSVRQPAAFCGITGLKPTYGRISRYGLVAFASSLDQVGILARDSRDVALLLNTCAGHDPKDSTSASVKTQDYLANLDHSVREIKVGIPREYLDEGLNPEIRNALDEAKQVLRSLGIKLVDLSLPMTAYGVATYYLVASCEASGNLARYDGAHYGLRANSGEDSSENELLRMYRKTRSEGFGTEVKRRIMLGTYALSSGYYDAYYLKALKTRRLIQEELKLAFQDVDLILGPTTPTTAYRIGEKSADPLAMYLGDIYTVVANLAGIPAISFPAGISSSGLPIGLQLQGPAFSENLLLQATHAFQTLTDWHRKDPDFITQGLSPPREGHHD